jgi:DNA-binding LacI/PurR family transcriptional regulator
MAATTRKERDVMAVKLEDVARYARVSAATVSRVLAGKSNGRRDVKQRVLEAVELLDYEPNRMAQSLRLQRSHLIGLVVSDIQNPFFTSIVRAIEDSLSKAGFAVLLFNTDDNAAKESYYLNFLKAEKVSGVIIAPTEGATQNLPALLKANIPVVAIDRALTGLEVDSVTTNNREASYQLVKTLLQQGQVQQRQQRIGAILPPMSVMTGRERYEGYRQALREGGISIFEELVITGHESESYGYQSAKTLLETAQPATALFLGTKVITLGALRYLFETGRTIPDDVALAAFDKLDWMPHLPDIPYAEQSSYSIGEVAVRLLLERMDQPKRSLQTVILPSAIKTTRDYS